MKPLLQPRTVGQLAAALAKLPQQWRVALHDPNANLTFAVAGLDAGLVVRHEGRAGESPFEMAALLLPGEELIMTKPAKAD